MKQDVINELKYSWNNKDSYFYEPENADVKAAVDGAVLENNKEFLDKADRLAKYNAQWLSQGKYVDPEQSEEYTKIVERHKYVKKRVENSNLCRKTGTGDGMTGRIRAPS